MVIIGLCGYAGSGKDTVASELVAHGYTRRAYADGVREALYRLNPKVTDTDTVQTLVDRVGWDVAKTLYVQVRELLQRLGTEVGREMFGADVWVDRLFLQRPPGERTVITDVRFPNESRRIRDAGGVVWRVRRPGVGPANSHASELAMEGYPADLEIWNDGGLGELREEVAAALENIEMTMAYEQMDRERPIGVELP